MIICIKIAGKLHCFTIPIFEYPIKFPKVGPGPVNYEQLVADATILGSVKAAMQHVSDNHVRGALEKGFSSALEAMQKRAGADVTIRAE
jgi:hypothetical protein